jgi:hypothetical protein
MKKLVRDLKPNDHFLDSFGNALVVESIGQVIESTISRSYPKVKIFLITQKGNRMHMIFDANREVEFFSKQELIKDPGKDS